MSDEMKPSAEAIEISAERIPHQQALQAAEEEMDGLVSTAKHYAGPDFGNPTPPHRASFVLHAIHHIGGGRDSYKAALLAEEQRTQELEARVRQYEGCPSCSEFHDEATMCPPHEVRFKGFTPLEKIMRDRDKHKARADRLAGEVATAKQSLTVLRNLCDGLLEQRDQLTAQLAEQRVTLEGVVESQRSTIEKLLETCAALRAQVEGRWLPIESAPKDGSMILLYPSRCWTEDEDRGEVGYWNDDFTQWGGVGPTAEDYHGPTHWQPLPPPLSEGGKQ